MTEQFLVEQKKRLLKRIVVYTDFLNGRSDGRPEGAIELKKTHALPYIYAALQRMEEGKYGVCLDCEEKIPQERLKIVVGAIRCRECQEVFDELENHRR